MSETGLPLPPSVEAMLAQGELDLGGALGTPEEAASGDVAASSDHIGKFQRDASETQRQAAIQAYPFSGSKRREVLDAIRSAPEGLTDEEIQHRLRMNPSTQRPRRVELVEGGWIVDSGETRPTNSGRAATVWTAVERTDR